MWGWKTTDCTICIRCSFFLTNKMTFLRHSTPFQSRCWDTHSNYIAFCNSMHPVDPIRGVVSHPVEPHEGGVLSNKCLDLGKVKVVWWLHTYITRATQNDEHTSTRVEMAFLSSLTPMHVLLPSPPELHHFFLAFDQINTPISDSIRGVVTQWRCTDGASIQIHNPFWVYPSIHPNKPITISNSVFHFKSIVCFHPMPLCSLSLFFSLSHSLPTPPPRHHMKPRQNHVIQLHTPSTSFIATELPKTTREQCKRKSDVWTWLFSFHFPAIWSVVVAFILSPVVSLFPHASLILSTNLSRLTLPISFTHFF